MSSEVVAVSLQHDVILRPEHETIVNEYSKPALACRTREIYGDFARQFDAWRVCNSYPVTFPVEARVVIAWLTDLAVTEKRATGTIGIALAAIKYLHAQRGVPFDGGPAVANAMRHIRRGYRKPQDQAAPLTHDMLADILKFPISTPLDVRDNCLLSLAYIFALRRDELATMDYMQLGPGKSVLEIKPEVLSVTFHRSKTAQEGGEVVVVPRDANPWATGAILRWVREGDIKPGTPLMRQVRPRGHTVTDRPITGDLVGRVIRLRAHQFFLARGESEEAALAHAALFSGHSGRVGFVVSATNAGVHPEHIGLVTRHQPGSAMIRRYGAQAQQERNSPHRTKGVGV